MFPHWDDMVKYQTLTIQFMMDFEKYIDWSLISRFQRFQRHLYGFRDLLDWNIIIEQYPIKMSELRCLNKSSIIHRILYKPLISKEIKQKNAALVIQRVYRAYQLRNRLYIINKFNLPKDVCMRIVAFLS